MRYKRIICSQWLILQKAMGKEAQDAEIINGGAIAESYS